MKLHHVIQFPLCPDTTPLFTHQTSGGVTATRLHHLVNIPSCPRSSALEFPKREALSLSLQNQDPLTYKRVSMSHTALRAANLAHTTCRGEGGGVVDRWLLW